MADNCRKDESLPPNNKRLKRNQASECTDVARKTVVEASIFPGAMTATDGEHEDIHMINNEQSDNFSTLRRRDNREMENIPDYRKLQAEYFGSCGHENNAAMMEMSTTATNATRSFLSFQEFLSVPLPFIFRQIPITNANRLSSSSSTTTILPLPHASNNNQHKPLLSRNEAQIFLTVTTLAMNLDALLAISTQVMSQQLELQTFCSTLTRSTFGGGSRTGGWWGGNSLIALNRIVWEEWSNASLLKIQQELDLILQQFQTSVLIPLQQSSDQNWTTYESLVGVEEDEIDNNVDDDGVDMSQRRRTKASNNPANLIALEKRYLAEIQDELIRRIEYIIASSSSSENETNQTWTRENGVDEEATAATTAIMSMVDQIPLSQFCHQIIHGSAGGGWVNRSTDSQSQESQQNPFAGKAVNFDYGDNDDENSNNRPKNGNKPAPAALAAHRQYEQTANEQAGADPAQSRQSTYNDGRESEDGEQQHVQINEEDEEAAIMLLTDPSTSDAPAATGAALESRTSNTQNAAEALSAFALYDSQWPS